MKKYEGIFPALLTPFDAQDKINEKELEKLIKMNLDKGVTGFYVGGSTAEAFLLSQDERMYLYKLVKDIAGDSCTLLAHVGAISTKESIKYAKYAEELGYDAVSSISPFYYKFSFKEIKKHYFDIVDSVSLPMFIYNFPNFSGVNLTVSNISEFLTDDRFIGVKHTSNDFFALEQFKTAFPNKIIYNGFDEMFLSGISMGADGGVGSTYNFMAEKYIKMMELHKAGKMDEAYAIQKDANKVLAALIDIGIMQAEKAVMNLMGFDFGKARAPFGDVSAEEMKRLEKDVLPLLQPLN